MGNCALKPRVLSETGAPAPEEINESLLEDQKIVAAKSLNNLFLQDMTKKEMKEDEKTTTENIPVTEDLKAVLVEEISLSIETKAEGTEVDSHVKETKAHVDDQEFKKVEAVRGEKVNDVNVKETVTETKIEEVGRVVVVAA